MFIEQLKAIIAQERVNKSKLARAADMARSGLYEILDRGRDPNPATQTRLVAALSEVTGRRYQVRSIILENQGGYSEVETNCKGCYGPCGHCEELNNKPETAKN